MNIIITNDDGIYADGLLHLFNRLKKDHDVTVVAPDREQSGVSHSFTLNQPISFSPVKINGGIDGWKVSGTPADCVKVGITKITDNKPDVVISGINAGDNSGVSQFYSGTIGGAREAALWGIPAIAVSIFDNREDQFLMAAKFINDNLEGLIKSCPSDNPVLLNVNFPNVDNDEIKGVRVTSQGRAMFSDNYIHRKDPRNNDYYWIYGQKPKKDYLEGTDETELDKGFITITPLLVDCTNYVVKDSLKKEFKANL